MVRIGALGLFPWLLQIVTEKREDQQLMMDCANISTQNRWEELVHPHQDQPEFPGNARGRGLRPSTITCCRSIRISTSSLARDFNRDRTTSRSLVRNADISSPLAQLSHSVTRMTFSVATPRPRLTSSSIHPGWVLTKDNYFKTDAPRRFRSRSCRVLGHRTT